MKQYNIQIVSNHQMKENPWLQKEMKRIMMDSNHLFVPSLFERIEEGQTLKEKVRNRVQERMNKGYHYFIIYDNKQVIGFTEFVLGDTLVHHEMVFSMIIGTTCICIEYQGKGVAKELYYEIDEKAKEFNVDVVVRSTWSTNVRQLKLYERYGYQEIEREDNARGENVHLLKFCKRFK